jgi:ribonucleoside-diphosphate reductase beta chain
MMKQNNNPYLKATDWNQLDDRIDKSAWARLNDILWEPNRIPLREDLKDFHSLDSNWQNLILHGLGQVALISTLQSKVGLEAEKSVAMTPTEFSVLNALQFLETINNKAYAVAIAEFSPNDTREPMEWAENDQALQDNLRLLQATYQQGDALQKRAAAIITSIVMYHKGFYPSLYLFGEHKMVRLAEMIKDAMRGTAFSGIYPGRKFRLLFKKVGQQQREDFQVWLKDFCEEFLHNVKIDLNLLYQDRPEMIPDVKHYLHYTMNNALMNMGQKTIFPETDKDLNPLAQKGIIKSANGMDFFYYRNEHALTSYIETK